MTFSYEELLKVGFSYIGTKEVALVLGISPLAASRLVRQGKIPGIKIGGIYVVLRSAVLDFAKGYVPRRGRPRTKRKYTKGSPKWNTAA